jgi:hypothetical protein
MIFAARIAALRAPLTARSDRHPRRHLRDREHRVESAGHGVRAGQRHADHRQVGMRRRDTGLEPRPGRHPR